MVLFVAPFRERQAGRSFVVGGLMMVVLLTLSLFSTTVLAEPPVAQVEEVCGLMHSCQGALYFDLCTLPSWRTIQSTKYKAQSSIPVQRVSVACQVNPSI